jgi:hypothetical protein
MTSFGTFAENMQFRAAMDSTLSSTGPSLGAAEVRAALNGANLNNLSTQEKNVLLAVTDGLAADGHVSTADAHVIAGLVDSYQSSGRFFDTLSGGNRGKLETPNEFDAFESSASSGIETLAKLFTPNPLFGGLLGFLSGKIAQTFRDIVFEGATQGMLGTCDGCANQQRVSSALYGADLSKLSPAERGTVSAMVGFASADGHISRAESNAIIGFLNRAQGIVPHTSPEWTVQQNGGQAHIDLGNYTLDLDEGNSEFLLTNKATGETTRVWGDPHVEVDGQHVGDFKGRMTLNLDDGTKISINTTPYAAGNGMTLSSGLTITKGDQAIVVGGLDQNTLGDLQINQSKIGGQLFDAIQPDGAEIYENPGSNAGWLQFNEGGFLSPVDGNFLASVD